MDEKIRVRIVPFVGADGENPGEPVSPYVELEASDGTRFTTGITWEEASNMTGDEFKEKLKEFIPDKYSEPEPYAVIDDKEAFKIDPNNPVNEISSEQVAQLLKQVEDIVKIMEQQWMASARELHLNDTHMKMLGKWNDDHKTEMPKDLSEEERQQWDYLNGLDCITEEAVAEIFEEGHPIYGVDHSQTKDRIKAAAKDFFEWLSAMREYRSIHDGYLQLIEAEEEQSIEILKLRAESEEDPVRSYMEKSIKTYYNRKYLEFLAEPLDDKDRDRLLAALNDERKTEYWMKRCVDKLGQLKISPNFIREIYAFEKRFLPEKYHKNSNILLLYFMSTSIYCDAYNKKDDGRTKTVCMVMALDGVIRNTWPQEKKDRIFASVLAFEDQFLPFIDEPPVDHTIAPPIVDEDDLEYYEE